MSLIRSARMNGQDPYANLQPIYHINKSLFLFGVRLRFPDFEQR